MSRLSTCKGCGKKLNKEEKYTYSNKTYCKQCYDIKIQEKTEYDTLMNMIMDYYSLEKPTGFMLKQIKEYKEKYKFTYMGMQYTLWYAKEIKKYKFDKKYGVGLIKYEYTNAEDYYLQLEKIANSAKNAKPNKINKISIKNINQKEQNQNNQFLINLDDIIQGGDNA
jgi:hypothetical protein